MNNSINTTGLIPITVRSTEKFELSAFLNGQQWVLTGGTVNLLLSDPSGNLTTISATPSGVSASALWTVPNTPGAWLRAWDVTDASGIRQVSRAIPFTVISSPV